MNKHLVNLTLLPISPNFVQILEQENGRVTANEPIPCTLAVIDSIQQKYIFTNSQITSVKRELVSHSHWAGIVSLRE